MMRRKQPNSRRVGNKVAGGRSGCFVNHLMRLPLRSVLTLPISEVEGLGSGMKLVESGRLSVKDERVFDARRQALVIVSCIQGMIMVAR